MAEGSIAMAWTDFGGESEGVEEGNRTERWEEPVMTQSAVKIDGGLSDSMRTGMPRGEIEVEVDGFDGGGGRVS